jgi:thymidine kinase
MKLDEVALTDHVMNSDVILINEGQFFPDIHDVVVMLVETYKKHVVVCGLDGDFKRIKFGKLCDLIPFCDTITKLQAVCDCGQPSIFSHRTSTETAQVLIGSSNYKPLCRACYRNANVSTASANLSFSA